MQRIFTVSNIVIASILLISMLLESCGKLNTLTNYAPKEQTLPTVKAIPLPEETGELLKRQAFTTRQGHKVSFHQQDNIWHAKVVDRDDRQYGLPLIAAAIEVDKISSLSQQAQRAIVASKIEMKLPSNREVGWIRLGEQGIKGGMKACSTVDKTSYKREVRKEKLGMKEQEGREGQLLEEQLGYFSKLPIEVLGMILQYSFSKELLQLRGCSRLMHSYITGYQQPAVGIGKDKKPIGSMNLNHFLSEELDIRKLGYGTEDIPSFIFYHARNVKNLPISFWEYLQDTKVHTIDLSYNRIGSEGAAAAIGNALPASQITSLNLNGNNIGDQGAEAIGRALPGSQLTSLHLNGNQIGDQGAEAIGSALLASKVTSLDLRSNQIGGQGAVAIGSALPASKITSLYLDCNQIGDAGAAAIGRALPASQVTSLHLSYNRIGDQGAIAIGNALPASQLTSLHLSSNQIGDQGTIAIGKALPASQLTSLHLYNNNIGDQGAAAIGRALPASQATSINLTYNQIGDRGAIALGQALKNSKVTSIALWGNQIDEIMQKSLIEQYPHITWKF